MSILRLLRSTNASEIVDGLYALGSSGKEAVTPEIIQALIQLVDHQEPDVRAEVAAAAGIRLRLPELYSLFLGRLQGDEKASSVLSTMIDAITTLSLHGAGDRKELSITLGRYVLDDLEDDEVRGTAYLSLLKLWDKISPREYAIAPRALSEMTWDKDSVTSLTH